jgi:ribosomal protein L11 methyltransferase
MKDLLGEGIRQDWVEVCITTQIDAGELVGLLNDPWMVGAWQEESLIRLYWPRDRWTPEAHRNLRTLVQQIHGNNDCLSVRSLPDKDWNLVWARSVVPFRVGRRMVIRPSWQSVEIQPGDLELILDPKQAFGTGHHATTQLILEWLEVHIHGGECVLDVGTGSGILAMAALRLGAKSALGVDCDPVAIECARGYAAHNGFGSELNFAICDLTGLGSTQVDLVFANLDRGTLLDAATRFPRVLREAGRVILSGILTDDRAEITAAYCRVGGKLEWEEERDGWLALALSFHTAKS